MSGALECIKLVVERSGRNIVDRVNLSIRGGELAVIIGPNGAGKTTLLRCMAGMLTPTEGGVTFDGEDMKRVGMRERAKRIAYVMQVHEPPPPLPVRDFVLMARYAYMPAWGGYSKGDEAQADSAIATVGMDSFEGRGMNTLSGGECQKIYLAAALAQDTPVILLDEPGTHLDYRHQCEMAQLIESIHGKGGKTIVTVTHDLNQGALRDGRVIAMASGRVAFDGATTDLDADALESIYGVSFERFTRRDGSAAALPLLSEE